MNLKELENLLKAGGWMKRKRRGFITIEILAYISITYILFFVELHMLLNIYKSFEEINKVSAHYNNIQNFYINLNNLWVDDNIEQIYIDNNMLICKRKANDYVDSKNRMYCSNGSIHIKYSDYIKASMEEDVKTTNTMLSNVESMEIIKKKNLIYIKIKDNEGREFIRCI